MIRPLWTVTVFEELEIIGRYEYATFEAAEKRTQVLQSVFDRYGILARARTLPKSATLPYPTTMRAFPAVKRA